MEKQYFAAVDLGATSGRVMLAEAGDGKITLEEIRRFPNHLIQAGSHFHWDIYELYRNIVEGLKNIAGKGLKLTSIGIDTWGVDFVCVGKDGAFLRMPYAYRDPHTVGAAEKYFKEFSREKLYQTTGIQVMDFNSLFQLYTLRKNADSALEAADKILFMPDALSYLLTGKMVCEYSIATTAHIVDSHSRKLSSEVLKTIGLSEKHFAPLVYPSEKVGLLAPELQRQTGLGAVPVIAVGGHDTASAVASVPAKAEHFAYLSSGTWSLMGIESPEPLINAETSRLNFTNEGGICNTLRVLKNICGMWLLERCREKWPEVSYPVLIEEAGKAEAFRSLIHPDAPDFANPADMEAAITAYCRRTGQKLPESRGALVRCIFESLALRYRQVLENLDYLSGHRAEVLHIIGGGSKNGLLNQWTANSIARPVVAGPSEATAIGNVMMQCVAADPDLSVAQLRANLAESGDLKTFLPENTAVWEAAYTKFVEITK